MQKRTRVALVLLTATGIGLSAAPAIAGPADPVVQVVPPTPQLPPGPVTVTPPPPAEVISGGDPDTCIVVTYPFGLKDPWGQTESETCPTPWELIPWDKLP